jgi:hypothetical protein
MISVSGLTSMVVNAAFAPQIAVPASIIYSERPPLAQVNPKEVARDLLTTKQYKCFSALIGKESAWRDVKNPTSSASGIGQLLDSTYRNLGMEHSESKVSQLVATLAYIHRRHVSPCNAWSHFQKFNWY